MRKLEGIKVNSIAVGALFLMNFLFLGFAGMAASPENVGKIQTYVSQNVVPVMKPYRAEFEKHLSESEIAQIAEARSEFKRIIEIRKKAGLSVGLKKFQSSELTDSQVAILKETREQAYQALLKVMIIANNHENELQEIFQKVDTNRQTWSVDIRKIMNENRTSRDIRMSPVTRRNMQRLLPLKNLSNLVFIVWNPEESIAEYL